MRKIFYALFVIHIFSLKAYGQSGFNEKLKAAQFQIVISAIEFLATDASTYKINKIKDCSDCKNYDCIKKSVGNNPKTVQYIEDWKNYKIDSTEQKWQESLEKFRDSVRNSITLHGKEARKYLPTYAIFEKKINDIVKGITFPAHREGNGNSQAAKEEPKTKENDGADKPAKVGSENGNNNSIWSNIPFLISSIICVILILVIVILNRMAKSNRDDLVKELNSLRKEKSSEMRINQKNTDSLSNDMQALNQKIQELEVELSSERRKNQSGQQSPQYSPTQQSNNSEQQHPPSPTHKPAPQVRYARYADQSDGFSLSELLNEEGNDTIFEIIIQNSNTAKFKVANNLNAQKYALANASYFLNKTCKYDSFPSPDSIIQTDLPGELKLQGNKWQIVSQAKISFN